MTSRAPLLLTPPTVNHSKDRWVPPPGPGIPLDHKSSSLHSPCFGSPLSHPRLPFITPHFVDGSHVTPAMQTQLDLIQAGLPAGEQVVLVGAASLDLSGGFGVENYGDFSGHWVYGGSTSVEIPTWPNIGFIVTGTMDASGHLDQTNSNVYVTPGPHNCECTLVIGDQNDAAFERAGLIADPRVSPGFVDPAGGLELMRVHNVPPFTPVHEDMTVFDPFWASPGLHGFMFLGLLVPGFAANVVGAIQLNAHLDFMWYGIYGTTGALGAYSPITVINASDRGGCC